MSQFEAFIYGLVQGATEYLPVSSSAHLLLLPHILGENDPGLAFDVILHLGTLLATAIYFFNDWIEILKHPIPAKAFGPGDQRGDRPVMLSWIHLIVGTIPAVIAGLLLNHWIQDNMRSLYVLWVTIPGFGLLLWWIDKKKPSTRLAAEASVKDMFIIGCVQAMSLIPGVSRSGSTMTAARYLGFQRADAARLSFLLSMPVTAGAIVYEGRHWREVSDSFGSISPLIIGCVAALVSGAVAIHYLIKWVSKASFAIFAVYRVILGIVIAVFLK
ncbi:MAG: undecaprenyl-diphosphate phosphatase [Bdellovibrionales bacterium]|nr:undecaprenyl-diphosphate phosphatase [Bdellovibrionales bacterium]